MILCKNLTKNLVHYFQFLPATDQIDSFETLSLSLASFNCYQKFRGLAFRPKLKHTASFPLFCLPFSYSSPK